MAPSYWDQPMKPPRVNKWLADHRRPVRVVLFTLNAALILYLILGTLAGGLPWYAYLQLVVWASVTTTLGWVVPSGVDRWRTSEASRAIGRHDQSGAVDH